MIVKLNKDGTLSKYNDRVFQMSNGMNTIALFSSVSKLSYIIINFRLPDGRKIFGPMIYSGYSLDENNNCWIYKIQDNITEIVGRVELSIEVRNTRESKEITMSAITYIDIEESIHGDFPIEPVDELLNISNEALVKANEAYSYSKDITDQAKEYADNKSEEAKALWEGYIQAGDTNLEVVNARGSFPYLSSRLNNNDKFLKNGEIKLPLNFSVLPFKIYKTGNRKFEHKVTPYNQYNWNSAIHIYIVHSGGTSGDGKSITAPISLGRFQTNLDSGIYGSDKTFVINILSNVFHHNGICDLTNKGLNVLIRSMSLSGFTWIITSRTSSQLSYTWVQNNGIYSTSLSSDGIVYDVINFANTDMYGAPYPYKLANSLEECNTTKGTYIKDNLTIYCNPNDGDDISLNLINFYTSKALTIAGNNPIVMFENIGFTENSYKFNPGILSNKLYFFGCKFYRGLQDAFAITGLYNVYLFDCVAAYGSKDGFNYHASNRNCLAVEVNCIAYGSGKYKLPGGNTTTNSNNASTAHDGMNILRIGGKYWETEGPIVADADDCYSISIGCEAYNILNSTTGSKSAFLVYNTVGVPAINNKYFIECLAYGKFLQAGFNGTDETYYMNLQGFNKIVGNLNELTSWEE